MDFASGNGGSGDERESSGSGEKGKKCCHRHTAQQIQHLEAFFKECPHPDDNQRRLLSANLGLEPKQIKFWFQNKRTQAKTQTERADNSTLRAENERIYSENLAMREALSNVICPACGGPPFADEERKESVRKLQTEHARLQKEHQKSVVLLARCVGKPVSQIESILPIAGLSLDPFATPSLGVNAIRARNSSPLPSDRPTVAPEMEKARMVETAARALDELTKLLRVNEPLWTKSSTTNRFTLMRGSYAKTFPRPAHFKSSTARFESSKDSVLVPMDSLSLVDAVLDPDKWADMFPTIVNQARTIEVIEPGIPGIRSGSLQLMYEQVHVLSPLVPVRDFYFLRYCQQIEEGIWVIADVSYNGAARNISHARSWRLPSGFMIQDMPDGSSKVTWVEHVEVDDKAQTHRLYRDIVVSGMAYGAERWLAALERTCERLTYSTSDDAAARDFGGVVGLSEGRRSIMNLAWRMVQDFCANLGMPGKLDFPQVAEPNNSGIRISVRGSTVSGEPRGVILSAATSLWLPLPPETLFNFFTDEKTRVQWDVLTDGGPVHEVARISIGPHQGNSISIIRPLVQGEENVLMLQESCIDHLGSLIVYAPVNEASLNAAVSGEDSSGIPLLPTGFIICGDNSHPARQGASSSSSGQATNRRGSLLTVAFQTLAAQDDQLKTASVANINTLVSSTVQKIKAAFNCC